MIPFSLIAVRKFIEYAHRIGARVSFSKLPHEPPDTELTAFLRNVMRRWEKRDARRIVVFAKGVILRRLVREASHAEDDRKARRVA